MKVLLNLDGIVAESICCQMLWRHSLASLLEAVSTILGEPTFLEPPFVQKCVEPALEPMK